MPYVNVNFSDVESFEPVPEDEYPIEVDKVEVRANKAGDGLYLNWELIIIDGDYENRRLWMITSLKETALFRLKAILENLELLDEEDEIDLEYDDDVEPSTKGGPRLLEPDVEGLEAIAVVKNEMYDGREQNRVKDVYVERKTKKQPKSSSRKRQVSSSDDGRGDSKTRRSGGSRRRIR